jgi:GT2 family glycosyltransferase
MKTPENPQIATVVISWNNQDILGECYESIEDQDFDSHVTLLVDNGSEDDSVRFTQDNFPWVEVYEANANLGFAKGNNIGIHYLLNKYPSLKYIVLLNSDARLKENWFSTLLHFAEKNQMALCFRARRSTTTTTT